MHFLLIYCAAVPDTDFFLPSKRFEIVYINRYVCSKAVKMETQQNHENENKSKPTARAEVI